MSLSRGARTGAALVVLALVCGAGGAASTRLRIGTDVAELVPQDAERHAASFLKVLAQSELARTAVLSVRGRTHAATLDATRALATAMRHAPEVAWMRGSVDTRTEEAVRALYYPRRASFAFLDEAAARDGLGDAGLAASARELRAELGLPTAPLVRAVAAEDPLLVFPRLVRDLASMADGGRTEDGVLVAADGEHGIVVLGTRRSPFDGAASELFLAGLQRATAAVVRAYPGTVVETSALHRYEVEGETGAKRDIVVVSVVSTVLVALLLFAVLEARSAFVVWAPVLAGMAAGFVATTLVYGSVHALTLAFGTTLVGITGDFGIHLLGSAALWGHGTVDDTLKRVWPGIRLGGLTTIAGLVGLGATSFPGLREMAVFTSAGVVGALATTYWLVPALAAETPRPTPLSKRASQLVARALDAIIARRGVAAVVAAVLVAACGAGIARLRWSGSLVDLATRSPTTIGEDERVRALVTRLDAGLVVVAEGATDEQALRATERAVPRLDAAVQRGALDGYRSIATLLRSDRAQRASLHALRDPALPARLDRAYGAAGFVPGVFAPFFASLSATPAPLRHEDLARSSLADLARPFRATGDGRVLYLAYPRGVHDAPRLVSMLRGTPGVTVLDQRALLSRAYSRYRDRTLEMTLLGLVAVAVIVWLRYRSLRLTLGAVAPALLAGTAALGVVGWLGADANLLHAMGLLLVLSLSVDYGIYVVEHHGDPQERAASTLSVLVAALTTVLSFGALAFSSSPALRSLGIVSAVGLLFAMLLAPLGMALATPAKEPS